MWGRYPTYMLASIAITTVILAMIVMIIMARKRGRALVPVKFESAIALSTLANDTVITAQALTLAQDFDVISTDMTITIAGLTAGEGPIDVGLADSVYSVAEIREWINAEPTREYGVAAEQAKRRCRLFGTFSGNETEETLNDGLPIRKRMFIRGIAGQPIADIWANNNTGATLTTGAVVSFQGTHWGRWK